MIFDGSFYAIDWMYIFVRKSRILRFYRVKESPVAFYEYKCMNQDHERSIRNVKKAHS